MPWTARIHPQLPIVEASYSGVLTASELDASFARTLELLQAHDRSRVIADCTGLVGGHSFADLLHLAEVLSGTDLAPRIREAVVLPVAPGSASSVEYWRSTCAEHGMDVRAFHDRQQALDWLVAS